ncbi:MAG: A/G-specific adenine glycosylase [Lachnospiraceae bacterium]|nr:A/G-specific adenine glycosylase [Lachnospiraceae bacterium]
MCAEDMEQDNHQIILEEALPPLLAWYEKNRRILPWREDPTPYHVWVSEIMLQQTRVEAVKGYYTRFMETLPTVQSLAEAEEDILNKLWEGLGYYSRVRNLGKAARLVEEQYGGIIPDVESELLKLSGIGVYTAAAIASIAFGKNAAAVDGNVLRVITRLLADDTDIGEDTFKKRVKALLENVYESITEHQHHTSVAGRLNQAFMDLGATVCLPNSQPKCDLCPMVSYCKAHAQGKELTYPCKAPKKERVIEKKTILLVRKEGKILLHKRPPQGLLAGLYEFPNIDGRCSEKKVLLYLKEKGILAVRIQKLSDAKHIFTHKEWHMTGYEVRMDEISEEGFQAEEGYFWVNREELQNKYAMPSAFGKYINLV